MSLKSHFIINLETLPHGEYTDYFEETARLSRSLGVAVRFTLAPDTFTTYPPMGLEAPTTYRDTVNGPSTVWSSSGPLTGSGDQRDDVGGRLGQEGQMVQRQFPYASPSRLAAGHRTARESGTFKLSSNPTCILLRFPSLRSGIVYLVIG